VEEKADFRSFAKGRFFMKDILNVLTVAGGVASVIALCFTCYFLGRRRPASSGGGDNKVLSASTALERFVRAALAKEPCNLDLIGYSVHALLDGLQPVVRRSLEAGKRVRVLMLSPNSAGLLEKSTLEKEEQRIDLAKLRERNRQQIEKTSERLYDLVGQIRYQANLAEVRLEVRLYNQLPVYRGVASSLRDAVFTSYLIDPRRPGRELGHIFITDGAAHSPCRADELNAFMQWFEYLWNHRSRPATIECVVFDLYDTLITVRPEARSDARVEMCRLSGISEQEMEQYWEQTREDSNGGRIASTKDRFMRILEIAGKDAHEEIASQLSAIEHRLLREDIEYCSHAAETLRTLAERGYRLAILTNCSASVISAISGSGITRYAALLRLSFEMGELKPTPTVYQDVVAALASMASRCVFVGDGANDEMEGAREAGLKTVLLGSAGVKRSLADYTIHDLSELPDVLLRME